jgi:hypothetical protein
MTLPPRSPAERPRSGQSGGPQGAWVRAGGRRRPGENPVAPKRTDLWTPAGEDRERCPLSWASPPESAHPSHSKPSTGSISVPNRTRTSPGWPAGFRRGRHPPATPPAGDAQSRRRRPVPPAMPSPAGDAQSRRQCPVPPATPGPEDRPRFLGIYFAAAVNRRPKLKRIPIHVRGVRWSQTAHGPRGRRSQHSAVTRPVRRRRWPGRPKPVPAGRRPQAPPAWEAQTGAGGARAWEAQTGAGAAPTSNPRPAGRFPRGAVSRRRWWPASR